MSTTEERAEDRSADDAEPGSAVDDATVASAPVVANSLQDYLRAWWHRARSGDSGSLPVIVGLILIVVFFQSQKSVFLSAGNLANLFAQSGAIVLLGMAEVFVLLLGEIDLSAGYVGVIGALFGIWVSSSHGWPWLPSILLALVIPAIIGIGLGTIIVRLRVPSFVVTLAGLLGFEGVLLFLTDKLPGPNAGGVLSISNPVIGKLVNGNLPAAVGWVLMIVGVLAFAGALLWRDRGLRRAGLESPPLGMTVAKIVAVAIGGVAVVWICNQNRGFGLTTLSGVPWVVPIVLAILVMWTVLLGRTRFGRYVYAIGGNAEATRRAGVNLNRVRIACFGLCSLTAGMSGIIYASYLGSVSANVDGGQLVLYAVAAAVIGGTSLFGGRGKMVHALLGGLVIAVIENGLLLFQVSAAGQYIVTALVLLAAVAVDALARRGRSVA